MAVPRALGGVVVHKQLYRWIFFAVAVISLALGASGFAPANTPAPPVNDAYLNSLGLNGPGTPLNRTDTLKDVRNTTNASVQTNIFDPCGRVTCPAGPSEVNSCRGVNYGRTIWYDFYPDTDGVVQIRTSGFDNVITLYPFSLKTALPNVGKSRCVHNSSFPSEQMSAPVLKRHSYTIQVGGVNDAGGPLQFLFDFFATPPHRLSAQSTLEAKQTSNGVELLGLSVSAARSADVAVSCGRFCRRESKTKQAVETFPHLKGVRMPAGSTLGIRVTAPHSIGVYIEYDILVGNFKKRTRCLEPGSRSPRRTCH
jgi:hypothetical protein